MVEWYLVWVLEVAAKTRVNVRGQTRIIVLGVKEVHTSFIDFPCGVFKIYKVSPTLLQSKKVMTFFLEMNHKFSLDLKHHFTSISTKLFPIYIQYFQNFPLIEILIKML